jgi:hypothetical protein
VYFLRAVNGVIGLLHCWLVLLCLRPLFCGNLRARAGGLSVVAFLRPNSYRVQHLIDEPLAAILATLAIYSSLRVLRAEGEGLCMTIGLGVALGAGMVAAFSVLLALPVFLAALIERQAARKQLAPRDWFRSGGGERTLQSPWNYDLMSAGYWVSLGGSLLPILQPDYADARKNLAIALAAKGGASPPPGAATNR